MKEYAYLDRWERQENYGGEDYSEYFGVYAQHRDSEQWERSNYRSLLKEAEEFLENNPEGDDDVEKIVDGHFGHWAVGWVDFLMIHESCKKLLLHMDECATKIKEDYPIFDEDDLYRLKEEDGYDEWEEEEDEEEDEEEEYDEEEEEDIYDEDGFINLKGGGIYDKQPELPLTNDDEEDCP